MYNMDQALAIEDGIYSADVLIDATFSGTVIMEESSGPLVAAGIPVAPPKEWFNNPKLSGVSPLTITSDGHVYGHIAAWHTSHIGLAGGIKPPKSKSNYAFFRTGVLETAEGDMVDVGQVTLAGGHADLNKSVRAAVQHYDDTNTAVMDVAAGEDRYGIWVAGALRPSVSPEQVRTIRASSVSGDWRPINGRLELVAVCAVNCPGFPIPRARVASGAPIALVAAGVEPIYEQTLHNRMDSEIEKGIRAGVSIFRERVRSIEAALTNGQMDQLRERVFGTPTDSTDDAEPVVAASDLRRRVHKPVVAALQERVHPEYGGLRERVHGEAAPLG